MVEEGTALAPDPNREQAPDSSRSPSRSGFYLAGLYESISTLIEERHAALTSAIYSAPTKIQVGDDIDHLNLVDRLQRLSYTQTQSPTAPGEFALMPGAIWINVREFRAGAKRLSRRAYPAGAARQEDHRHCRCLWRGAEARASWSPR